ncbi:16S rRNA (guanine(527)-N(7))-methyltransferase RsmG [Arsenicicoccus dermatophilus]|uniref:16S rRNA (guanine(527)-N(7))-methyltransferase RsmG n=1 Tax=Arsenicicoccus dermatophilus TaxID=1076331 RepID=UPI001F4D3561|nr:16S rRNA (guanine(527)-N(7))-methyltransferase RsmG [Arsenicicoccus dermatophilus]MCH8614087.1 16S rRNA (guanine(527)-N(7))-methyltransferase RsmG [Arsenicicoccus dermatophilus]
MAERPSDGAVPEVGAALPSVPPEALQVYGDHLERAEAFVATLGTSGVEHGLIGPREVLRLWERHVLNCAVVAELVPPSVEVVDVGSGAGLPGLALAIARPDVRVHLVEARQRATDWLGATAAALDLDNVAVHHARAQDVVGRIEVPFATARAVTRLGQLTRWCAPLLAPGGVILALKGRSVQQELSDEDAELTAAGVVAATVVTCGSWLDEPTTVARLRLADTHRPGVPIETVSALRRGRAGKGRRPR